MLHVDLPGAREKLGRGRGLGREGEGRRLVRARRQHRLAPAVPEPRSRLGGRHLGRERATASRCCSTATSRTGRGLRVLEVGAAKAWAAPYWKERDCEYVATDILTDKNIGLGRGAFYGDFGRVQADGEHLPFASETFDVDLLLRDAAPRARPAGDGAGDGARDQARRHRRRAERRDEGRRAQLGEPRPGGGEGARDQRARPHDLGLRRRVHAGRARDPPARAVRRLRRRGASARRSRRVPKVGQTLGTLAHLSAGEYSGVTIYARRR